MCGRCSFGAKLNVNELQPCRVALVLFLCERCMRAYCVLFSCVIVVLHLLEVNVKKTGSRALVKKKKIYVRADT